MNTIRYVFEAKTKCLLKPKLPAFFLFGPGLFRLALASESESESRSTSLGDESAVADVTSYRPLKKNRQIHLKTIY